jgi:hypothetical protein
MADKFSVLIKYSYLDVANNANLSNEDFGLLMKSVIDYDRTGVEPAFKKQNLSMAFAFIKCDLDKNKKKWEERVYANQSNGKKGGRPPKTQITQSNPNNPLGFSETQITQPNPKNPIEPKKPDLTCSGCVSGYDLDPDNININSSSSIQPPQLFEQIKKESAAHGFFLKTAVIKEIVKQHDNLEWLLPPYSFLEFCAISIRKKYPDKDDDALNSIFISAVKNKEKWEDFRDAYPQWKSKQQKITAKKDHEKAIEKARNNPPQKCKCGGEFKSNGETYLCMSCGQMYVLDENLLKWVLRK